MSKAFIRFPSSAQCLYLNISAYPDSGSAVLMWFIQLRFSERTQTKRAYFNCMTFDVVNIVVTVWTLEIRMYSARN